MFPLNGLMMWLLFLPFPNPEAMKVINQMGDEEWSVREDASTLAKKEFGFPELRLFEWHAAHNKDLEIRRRCNRWVSNYYTVWHTHKDFDHLPWIDSMQKEDFPKCDEIVQTYTPRARKELWGKEWYYSPGWPEYRYATRLYCRDLLSQGVPHAEITKMLNKMVTWEKKWREENNYNKMRILWNRGQ